MRNLFLIFLAANIFIFMFFYYLPGDQDGAKAIIPAGTDRLVLLSEVDKAALTPDTEQAGENVAQVKVKKVFEDKCFTIGPFREANKIAGFQAQIKDRVKKTGIRERVEKQHWRHWVYLTAGGSKAKAVKLASDLAKKGLKDYYVIARGEFINSVSLGHFKDKSLAEKRFQMIKEMGYDPKMSAIEKEYTLYWLDYVAKNGQGLSNQTLNGFDLEESIHQFKRECKK